MDAPNQWTAICRRCEIEVPAGAGVRRRLLSGRWRTYHEGCLHPDEGDHDGWHKLPMLGIDTETTGLSLDNARVINVGIITADETEHSWLLKTVEHIPPEATAVHGITDEAVARDGVDPVTGFAQIAELLSAAIAQRDLVVAFNARMDLTWLYREFARYGVTQPTWAAACVVDPLVIHLVADRTQTARSLAALSGEYKLADFAAHNAVADARRALEIAYAIGSRFPNHAKPHPLHITAHQRSRRKELLQAAAKSGRLQFNPDEPWPIVDIPDPKPRLTTPPCGGRRGGRWDDAELDQLSSELDAELDWQNIAARHQRTPLAVWSKARDADLVPYLTDPRSRRPAIAAPRPVNGSRSPPWVSYPPGRTGQYCRKAEATTADRREIPRPADHGDLRPVGPHRRAGADLQSHRRRTRSGGRLPQGPEQNSTSPRPAAAQSRRLQARR